MVSIRSQLDELLFDGIFEIELIWFRDSFYIEIEI